MRSVAAQCAALYPRYGERGCNLARGSAAAGQMGRAWLEIAAIAPEKNPMGGRVFSGFWRSAIAAVLTAVFMAVLAAGAGLSLQPGSAAAVPPVAQAAPSVPAGNVLLAVAARYGQNAPPISAGLIWRVYAAKPDS